MPKAKGKKEKEEEIDMDVDVEEEEEDYSSKKKGGKAPTKEAPKKGGKGKKGKAESEDEEEEEEEAPKKGGKQQKKGKGNKDDEEEEKPQKGKQAAKKGGKKEDSEDEEEQKGKQNKKGKKKGNKHDDSEEEDEQPQKKGGKQQKKGKKDESEEEEEEPQPKSKQSKKKGGKNDESEEEEEPVSKKGGKQANKKGAKKVESEDDEPTPKGKQAKKNKVDDDEDSAPKKGKQQQKKKGNKKEESDEEEEPVQKGKQGKKGKKEESDEEEEKPQKGKQGKKAAKKAESEDEESEEEPVAKKGGKQSQKKGKKADSDEEPVQKGKQQKGKKGKKGDDSEEEEEEKPVQKGKQANKKPAKKEESEEEEDEEEEEESEEEVVAPKKGGKAQPAKKNAPKKEEESEPEVAAAGMVSKKNKKNNKKKGGRKADSDSEPEVKSGGGFAGLADDDDEEDAPAGMVTKKNKKQNKPAAKSAGGFAGLDVEDEEEEEEVPVKKNNKKSGKAGGGFADLDVEDEEDVDNATSKMASLSIEKKSKKEAVRKEPKIKSADDTRSKKQIRMERKNAQRQSDQPAEEVKEKTQEELEEEALARYNQAQDMKGREPPPFVHLRNSEETRSKLGNDIKVENYTLQVPGRTLLADASFTLAYGHRYGFVGRNGLGKSSLLQKIADRDGIKIANHLRVLYVEQEVPGDDTTPIEYVLKADVEREWLLQEEKALNKLEAEDPYWMDNPDEKRCYGIKEIAERLRDIESEKAVSRASAILVGLGFDAEEIKTKTSREFSGGWRMRISLARALFCRPEVLLLDEPTNHLDLHACFWLERYLSKWKSTLLVVSHEATFLNEIVDHILEIRNKQLTTYRGDYWTFQKTRDINERTKAKKKDKNDKEKARLKEVIQRTAGKSGASGKDKMLAQIEDITIERDDPSLKVSFPDPDKLPPPIYQFQDVSFGYDPEKLLFKNLEFGVDMDSRIALVGLNGVGKSTLMKLMAGELKETSGYISRNRKCRIARFSQHSLEQLDSSLTPAEYLDKRFDIGSEHALRQHLGRFGITGNLALNKIETLSGGQKSRVVLAELAWAEPHILFLDEPSNHLDLDAIEALAQGLNNFGGGVVLISHNQRLISLVCNEIWVVTKAGTVDRFNGEFDDYKEDILAHMDFEGDEEEEDEQTVREREREQKKAKKAAKEEKEMEKTDKKKGGGKKNKK